MRFSILAAGTVHPPPGLFTWYCSSTVAGSLPRAVTMPDDIDAAAHGARLDAIIKEAEAQAAAVRRRVQAARLLLEEESNAAALEQTATTACQRVPSSSSSSSSPAAASQLVPTASSTYEDTVIVGLHLQAAAVLNVRQLDSTNYASWCDLMEQALQRYALIKHVTDDALSNDPGWIRMDSVVLNWISNSISTDLHQVVRERGCMTRHLWLAIKNQFLGNREQRTLHLDAAFHTFVQSDLSVNEYCRKFKAMVDGLADLGASVEDRILVLNILQGLNQRFEHMSSIIRRYSPFLNFLKVRDDLLLEEIHMDSTGPPATPTVLYINAASPAAKPPSFTPSRPPNGGNGSTGGNRNKNNNKNRNSGNGGGNNGKNNNSDGGHGGSSGQTTAPIGSDGRTNAPWPTYGHPWQGHMTMYPGLVPVGQQRPQAFVATPDLYVSPGLLSGPQQQQQRPMYQQAARPQAGTPGSAQARASSRWPTPSAPWRSTRPLPRSRTRWRTPARPTTPLHRLIIFLLFVLWPRPLLHLSL
jgi:hypothetical protein